MDAFSLCFMLWCEGSLSCAASCTVQKPVVDLRLPSIPSILPPHVAQQIREAQHRAALAGQAPPAWALGARCQAVWSGDGEWYSATVKSVTAHGSFVVSFDEYGDDEQVRIR